MDRYDIGNNHKYLIQNDKCTTESTVNPLNVYVVIKDRSAHKFLLTNSNKSIDKVYSLSK